VSVLAGDPFWPNEIKKFTQQTGIQVTVDQIPYDNLPTKLTAEALSKTGAIDVYVTDQLWLQQFASKHFIDPLNVPAADQSDFLSSALQGFSYQGKQYALPFTTQSPVLFYRTDLLKAAGFSSVPTTWDQLRAVAKAETNSATGVWGYPLQAGQNTNAGIGIMDTIIQAGGSVLSPDGSQVTLNSPAALKALNYWLDIQYTDKSSPPGALGYAYAEASKLFEQGKAGNMTGWQDEYAVFADPKQNKTSNDFSLAIQPGDVNQQTSVWSWGFSVASTSNNKPNAIKYVSWATSAPILKDVQDYYHAPAPRKSVAAQAADDPNLTAGQKNAYKVYGDAAAQGVVVTNSPYWPTIQEQINLMISKVMSKQETPEAALSSTTASIQQIIANGGTS
jgi:multiple sugar transport system substrate-binding protein